MTPAGHGRATYNPQYQMQQPQQEQPYYNNSNNPPPAYNANATQNQGYYGNSGVTEPTAAYTGQYAPPKDPPPGRF